jgi:hypothetical protein
LVKWDVGRYLPYYLSDDYVINHVVRREGLGVFFNPRSMVLAIEDCGVRDAFNWAVRQLWYVRIYGFRGFALYAVVYTIYAVTLPASLLLPPPLYLIGAVPYILGMIKDNMRIMGMIRVNREYGVRISRSFRLILPLASVLNVYFTLLAIVKALCTDKIEWRGRTYTSREAILMVHRHPLHWVLEASPGGDMGIPLGSWRIGDWP